MNRTDSFAERMDRLTCISDNLFGDAAEMDALEAESLLRAGGIDPDALKSRLYQRLHRQAQNHKRGGKPLSQRFTEALDDLRPLTPLQNEIEIVRQAKTTVKRVIERAKLLSKLLEGQDAPTFTMAYRNKKELTDRDKEILDSVAEEQRKRIEKFKGN
jgi:hypothetical protein